MKQFIPVTFIAFTSIMSLANCADEPLDEPPAISVSALIDGRSVLLVRGATVQWHHYEFTAPGLHGGANEPTSINGRDWYPTWPDDSCWDCVSSLFRELDPALPTVEQVVKVNPERARGLVRIVEQPTAANDFTLAVEFDDNSIGSSDVYEVAIYFDADLSP